VSVITKKKCPILTALLSSVVVLGIGTASCGDGAKHEVPMQARVHTHFAVFDAAWSRNDVLPPVVVASLREDGEQFTAKMFVRQVVAGSDPGWLVLTPNHELCLVRLIYPLVLGLSLPPLTSKICDSEEWAESGHLVETQSRVVQVGEPARNIVVGVVPDGVAAVRIQERDGHMIITSVTRNAYETLTMYPRSVEFVSKGRRFVLQLSSFDGGHYVPSTDNAFGSL
jgi:hypothetical protein